MKTIKSKTLGKLFSNERNKLIDPSHICNLVLECNCITIFQNINTKIGLWYIKIPGPGLNPLKASSALIRHSIEWPLSTISSCRKNGDKRKISKELQGKYLLSTCFYRSFSHIATRIWSSIKSIDEIISVTWCSTWSQPTPHPQKQKNESPKLISTAHKNWTCVILYQNFLSWVSY